MEVPGQCPNVHSPDRHPIFWISDPPHMIKKLRNFLVSDTRRLQSHDGIIDLMPLVSLMDDGKVDIQGKHLTLTPSSRMKVKLAVQLMSMNVVKDIWGHVQSAAEARVCYPLARYIEHVHRYFHHMNAPSLQNGYMRDLVNVMRYMRKWCALYQNDAAGRKLKFITVLTFNDLMRSIRGFIALVQHVEEHFPEVRIVPKSISQDDCENYFSLQRARKSGGDITLVDYMTGNAALQRHLMMQTVDGPQHMGSYSQCSVKDSSSVVLRRSAARKESNEEVC